MKISKLLLMLVVLTGFTALSSTQVQAQCPAGDLTFNNYSNCTFTGVLVFGDANCNETGSAFITITPGLNCFTPPAGSDVIYIKVYDLGPGGNGGAVVGGPAGCSPYQDIGKVIDCNNAVAFLAFDYNGQEAKITY